MTAARLRGLLVLLLALAPSAALGQGARRPIDEHGTEGFRALLAQKGLSPLVSLDELRRELSDPSQVLIVAFRGADAAGLPYPDLLASLRLDLHQDFVARGGGLLVATDQHVAGGWIAPFGAVVQGEMITASVRAIPYRDDPECPFIARFQNAEPNFFATAAGDAIDPVATNRPTHLKATASLDIVARFPRNSWKVRGSPFFNQFDGIFAQARRYDGGGRFLLLADHSVFINGMLLPSDEPNGNLAFASNCVDWMMRNSTGTRKYVLFIQDGHIWSRRDYDLMLQAMPAPGPEAIAALLRELPTLIRDHPEAVEEILAAVEEAGVFAELERSDPFGGFIEANFSRTSLLRLALIAGAVGLTVFGMRALIGSKQKWPRGGPRLAMMLDILRPRAGLLDHRLRSGLGQGQYYELARDRARAAFADLGVAPGDGGAPPRFTISAGWRQRRRLAQNLRELWAIAYSDEAPPVRARQWQSFQVKLREVATMIEAGVIRLE